MLIKLIKIFLYTAAATLVLFLVLFQPVSYEPYQQEAYYQQTLAALDSLSGQWKSRSRETLQAGWSRRNITPDQPVNLMGYGWKGNYEQVHDSLYVRVVVFSDGLQKVAFISYDLMIVHPDLVKAVQPLLTSPSSDIDHVYFSAIHTHHGYGEWATGLAGMITAGGYNEALVQMIASRTQEAVAAATSALAPVTIHYQQHALPSLVANRLVKGAHTDAWLRVIQLHKSTGENGLICTFSAHSTFITSKSKNLSADYPGALVKQLTEDPRVDFALFASGAVGSHSPIKGSHFSYEQLDQYAEKIASSYLNNMENIPLADTSVADTSVAGTPVADKNRLVFGSLPVTLGPPQLKISDSWQVRPWLFEAFFGEIHPAITILCIGNVVFAGYPADFSGLLYPDISVPPGFHLLITSFNGDYIGYIIPDRFYDRKHQEARELNWFGPYTGTYFVELTNRLLEELERNKK